MFRFLASIFILASVLLVVGTLAVVFGLATGILTVDDTRQAAGWLREAVSSSK
jgi:hypothetical protein